MNSLRAPAWFGGIFFFVGLVIMALGWFFLATQHYRIAHYLPVRARITQSRVATHESHDGGDDNNQDVTTYEPVISYNYRVNRHLYHGTRVTALGGNFAQSGDWAWRIVSQYPRGARVTAWYSPDDPSSSFLVREAEFVPHLFTVFGLPFMLTGAWLLFGNIRARRAPALPAPAVDGLFLLREKGTIRGHFRFYVAAALAWYGYFAAVISDYLTINGAHIDLFCIIAGGLGAAAGVVLLVQVVRYWRLWHDFLDAQVSTDRQEFHCGDTLHLHLNQVVRRPLELLELTLGAVCSRDDCTQSGTTTSYTTCEDRAVRQRLDIEQDYAAGQTLSAKAQITLPADANPSSPIGSGIYPHFTWCITLHVAAKNQPILRVNFPIIVHAGILPKSAAATQSQTSTESAVPSTVR